MTNQVYFLKGANVTLADGSYKKIEHLQKGDEVQTYDMSAESFDAANIRLNEQTTTKVDMVIKVSVKPEDMIKVGLKRYLDKDVYAEDEIEELKSNLHFDELVMGKHSVVMGGADAGWVVHDHDKFISDLEEFELDDEVDFSDEYGKLEVGSILSTDVNDNLAEAEVISIDEMDDEDHEVSVYSVIHLEKGDTIFVNDVLSRVYNLDVIEQDNQD